MVSVSGKDIRGVGRMGNGDFRARPLFARVKDAPWCVLCVRVFPEKNVSDLLPPRGDIKNKKKSPGRGLDMEWLELTCFNTA